MGILFSNINLKLIFSSATKDNNYMTEVYLKMIQLINKPF